MAKVDAIVALILEAVANPSATALIVAGWGMYFIERFYVAPSKDKQHKEDLKAHAEEFKAVANKTTDALAKFTTLLEVVKDRLGRGGS